MYRFTFFINRPINTNHFIRWNKASCPEELSSSKWTTIGRGYLFSVKHCDPGFYFYLQLFSGLFSCCSKDGINSFFKKSAHNSSGTSIKQLKFLYPIKRTLPKY